MILSIQNPSESSSIPRPLITHSVKLIGQVMDMCSKCLLKSGYHAGPLSFPFDQPMCIYRRSSFPICSLHSSLSCELVWVLCDRYPDCMQLLRPTSLAICLSIPVHILKAPKICSSCTCNSWPSFIISFSFNTCSRFSYSFTTLAMAATLILLCFSFCPAKMILSSCFFNLLHLSDPIAV